MKSKSHPHFYAKLAKFLLQQRNSAALSQAQMGAIIGTTFQMVQKYEKGNIRIPVDKLARWCRACCTNIAVAIAAAEAPDA